MEVVSFFSSISLIIAAASFTGVVSSILCLLAYSFKKVRNDANARLVIKVWGGLSLAAILLGLISYKIAIATVTNEIDKALASSETVLLVNGTELQDKKLIVAGFQSRFGVKKSGSYPADVVTVQILNSSGSFLDLELKQDSRDPDLYWVYYPDYRAFSNLFYVKIASLGN